MYSMSSTMRVARQATADITHWLLDRTDTVSLTNVEADPTYQSIDVDLLWTTANRTYRIEIKGDRLHSTGNFFFETSSNHERGTPGCFLYTEADFIFYYFVTPRLLYILPMPQTRAWFLGNIDRFTERSTRTAVENRYYTTIGRIVSIAAVMDEVSGTRLIQLTPLSTKAHQKW